MLAAIIANLQNEQPQSRPQPTVKIDRGGGGPSWPRYEIIDIIAAISTFPEISGENPVTRAARRHKWIGQALPFVKEAREKREAAAFLAGAQLADAAAEERHAAQDQLKIEQIIEIIDEVRGVASAVPPVPPALALAPHERGGRSAGESGIGLFVGGLVVGGILAGIALSKRAPRQRRR
jgi:hypothetical protein